MATSVVLCTLVDICIVIVQTESMSATYIKQITIMIIIMITDHARQVVFGKDVDKTCLLLYFTVCNFTLILRTCAVKSISCISCFTSTGDTSFSDIAHCLRTTTSVVYCALVDSCDSNVQTNTKMLVRIIVIIILRIIIIIIITRNTFKGLSRCVITYHTS